MNRVGYIVFTLFFLVGGQLNAQPFQETTTVGGYGELHYNEPDGTTRGKLDFHRFVIYLGHTFTEKLSFKSEVEIEHTRLEAGSAEGGELALEQAYLDWRFSESIGLKAGIILPPIGIINQVHEPTTFNGVERPNVERYIIPTTWRESGAGIYGTISEGVQYQIYLVAGLLAQDFSGSSGIRGGRQKAFESSPANPSVTGRLDFVPAPELQLGTSFFIGNTTDGNENLGQGRFSLISGDLQFTHDHFTLRALGAFESLTDVDKINAAFGNDVGESMHGYYIEGAYDVLPLFAPECDYSLDLFVRYERYKTHAGGPASQAFVISGRADRNETTLGATFKPTYNTVFKFDYQFFNNAASANTKQFNLGLGYSF